MNAPLPESIRQALERVTLDDKYTLPAGVATAGARPPQLGQQGGMCVSGHPGAGRRAARRWPSGSAAPASTSPSEKLVWMSFTLGSLNSVSMAQRL